MDDQSANNHLKEPLRLDGSIEELKERINQCLSVVGCLGNGKLQSQYKLGVLLLTLKSECKKPEYRKSVKFHDIISASFTKRQVYFYYLYDSSANHLIRVAVLIANYPRLAFVNTSFSDLKTNCAKIQLWFKSDKCGLLKASDLLSVSFCRHIPNGKALVIPEIIFKMAR